MKHPCIPENYSYVATNSQSQHKNQSETLSPQTRKVPHITQWDKNVIGDVDNSPCSVMKNWKVPKVVSFFLDKLLRIFPSSCYPTLKDKLLHDASSPLKRENRRPGILHCVEPQLNSCCTIRFIQLRTINSPSSVPTLKKRSELEQSDDCFPVPWLR